MKIGDVVRLRAGGPRMTISHVDGALITTLWIERYTENKEPINSYTFDSRMLQKVRVSGDDDDES